MKKSLIILAALASISLCLAVIFNMCNWHGQHAYTALSAGLTIIASIMAIICSFKGIFAHKWLAVLTSVSIFIAAFGLLLKGCSLPGGTVFLLGTLGILFPICIVWYAIVSLKKK